MDLGLAGQLAHRERDAGDQSAAAAGRQQQIGGRAELRQLAEYLTSDRALAGDDVWIVEGTDDGRAALLRDPRRDGFAVVAITVVEHDFSAIAAGIGDLDRGRVGGHDYGG